jgi:glycosyltransferase involved in cell wall biosynthesis
MPVAKHSREPRLSVAMIARDAEHLIAASLDSVREIADEIIVADTGSIDRTRHVALARATHVVTIPWIDDFSAARNACLDRVKGEWVLWLDAGETIDSTTAEEIRRFVDEDADPSQAYLICVELPPKADCLAGEQIGRIRLMPNKKKLRYTGRVRESLRAAIAAEGMSIEPTSWHIRRCVGDHAPAVKAKKSRRDLKLAELEIRDHGPAASPLIAMGEAWSNLGESGQAIECFQQALALCSRASTEMLEAYYGVLAAYDGRPNDGDLQIQTCADALAIFRSTPTAVCDASYMQNAADRSGQPGVSSRCNAWPDQLETYLRRYAKRPRPALSLARTHGTRRRRPCRARRAACRRRDSARLSRLLIDLHVKYDRRRDALEQVVKLSLAAVETDSLRTAVRGACLAAKKDWPSARTYLQAAYDAGCRDLLCLRWLAVTLISSEDFAAAEPILKQWQAAAPGTIEVQSYLDAVQSRQPAPAETTADSDPGASVADAGRLLRLDQPSLPAIGLFPPHVGALPSSAHDLTAG